LAQPKARAKHTLATLGFPKAQNAWDVAQLSDNECAAPLTFPPVRLDRELRILFFGGGSMPFRRRITLFAHAPRVEHAPRASMGVFSNAFLLLAVIVPATGSAPLAAAPISAAERGKYIALAADCSSCHTAPQGKPFAGGNALKSAFGTIYGPNITSDAETGIGAWDKADFERALRQGKRKDGAYLYPAMPYESYTKLRAADMDALWIYIKSIPAVRNTVPKNTLPFPLTIRGGLAVWQDLYFKPGEFNVTAGKDAQWNRGAYLVNALGHCNDCHTPRNIAQGLEMQHSMTGAQISGWYAPNISNDGLSKLNTWKIEELATYLKTGLKPGNVKSFGPMQEVIHDSLQYLTTADLKSMAVYLKDQDTGATSLAATKSKLPAETVARGKGLYEDNCSSCHQRDGKGVPGSAPALAGNDAVTADEPYNIIMAMLEGFAPQNSWGAMGSFATLSDDQIADIANYVRTAWGNAAQPNAAPWSVGNWRAHANAPSQDSRDALFCPTLAQEVMQPALDAGPAAVKQAATDHAKMSKLVNSYFAARPQSSTAQAIEALSSEYCRAVASDHLSQPLMDARIVDFAQRVAVAAQSRKPTG
jgi:mono/diheme cytochrome c family protein